MTAFILPLTNDPRQVMTLDRSIDGEGFHARIEVRYLCAPGVWVISVWDDSTGELLINHNNSDFLVVTESDHFKFCIQLLEQGYLLFQTITELPDSMPLVSLHHTGI